MVMCKYYLQGRCYYGDQCRNEHSYESNRSSNVFGGQQKTVGFSANVGVSSLSAVNYAQIKRAIEEEIRLSQGGKQWPFSSMCPLKESGNIPGYDDVSPEELRFEAYEAQTQNSFEVYTTRIETLKKEFDERNAKLVNMDIKSLEILITTGNYPGGNTNSFNSVGAPNPFQSSSSVFGANNTSSPKPFGQGLFGQASAPQTSMFGGATTAAAPASGLFASAVSPSTQPAFGQATPLFGQNSTFGQPNPSSGLFGQAPSQQTTFGQQQPQPSANLFGQAAQPQASNVFAPTQGVFSPQPQQQQQSASTMFGQVQNSTFGQTPATPTNLFGQAAPQQTTNAATPFVQSSNLFGQQPAQAGGTFGQVAAGSGASNIFGQKPIFGQQTFVPTTAGTTTGMFGQTAAAPSTNLFGQTAAAPATTQTSGLFGQAAAQPQSTPAPNPFGQSSGSLFSQPPPAFGQTGGSIFGQAPQAQATPASSSLFAQQQAPPPSGLFASATAAPPAFGQSTFGGASPAPFSQVPAFSPKPSIFAQPAAAEAASPFATPDTTFIKVEGMAKINPFAQSAPVQSNHYSEVSALTPLEIEAFEAPSFKLGAIPVHPPTQELCC